MKRYRYTFLLLIMILLLQTSALANDGGYSPDYIQYVIYEIKTDCTEVEIGETIKYTLTIKNKTKHLFEALFIERSIENTTIVSDDWFDSREYVDHEHGLDAYETRVIEMEITVPEHVGWYEVDGEYFLNLKPEISYWTDESKEVNEINKDMGWGYMNMIGVKPIPIKILNLNDGADKVSMDFIDERDSICFYNAVEYDWERNESNTYTGQYDGDIDNYISIQNNTNEQLELVYFNPISYYFARYDNSLTLWAEDKININTGRWYFMMPDEIPESIDIRYNATFKDANGDFYAVELKRSCNTKVLDISDLHLNIKLVGDNAIATITNKGNDEIRDLVVEYNVQAAESREEQENNSVITNLVQGKSLTIENIPYGKEKDRDEEVSNLRIGFMHQDVFVYSKMQFDFEENNEYDGKAEDVINSSWYVDFYNMDNHIELVDLVGVLSGEVTHEKPGITPTALPEPTPTEELMPKTTETDKVVTPDKEVSETESVNVISDKSFLVNNWIYICLVVVITILVALIIYKRITFSRKK